MALPPSRRTRPQPPTPLYHSNVPDIEAAAAGGGVSGSGTVGKIPKFTGVSALGDSLLTETGGIVSLTGGTLQLKQQDNALEGGEVQFDGGGNGGAPYAQWILDSWTGAMRFFTGGIVKWTLDTAGNMGVAGNVATVTTKIGDVGHGSTWAGVAHGSAFTTVLYGFLHNNTGLDTRVNAGTGGQVGIYLNNVVQWLVESSGHLTPAGGSNARDIGKTALRLRDIYIQGETIAQNGDNTNTANQATFVNVATNIQGCGWESGGSGEVWAFDIFIPFLPSSTAGVQFAIQGPVGSIGFTATGIQTQATAPPQWWSEYVVAINTFTGLHGITSASYYIHIVGSLTTNAAGSITVQGKTGAAGTNCTIRRGVSQNARRIA